MVNADADQGPTRAGGTPVLGRDDVLARADAMLADCREGRGGLLWLHGDAGIGKTRVLGEVAARAEGCLVLRGTGWEDPGTPSFWVWSQVLRGVAAVRPPDQWGERGRPAMPLLDGTTEVQPDLPGRFPLFDAVGGVLEDLTRERPVVLLLDDVHWVDEGSLRLLQLLTVELSTRPLLVVCAWRDHDELAGPHQAELAAQIAARGESWLLDGLPEHEVRCTARADVGPDA